MQRRPNDKSAAINPDVLGHLAPDDEPHSARNADAAQHDRRTGKKRRRLRRGGAIAAESKSPASARAARRKGLPSRRRLASSLAAEELEPCRRWTDVAGPRPGDGRAPTMRKPRTAAVNIAAKPTNSGRHGAARLRPGVSSNAGSRPQSTAKRQRPPGTGRLDRRAGQSAHGARDGESHLAAAVRPRHRGHRRTTSA